MRMRPTVAKAMVGAVFCRPHTRFTWLLTWRQELVTGSSNLCRDGLIKMEGYGRSGPAHSEVWLELCRA